MQWLEVAGFRESSDPTCELTLTSPCSYDIDGTLQVAGNNIKALIENEINNNGISADDVYLAGFSQGGQTVYHTAFGQLDYAIGGYFAYSTSPMYPLFQSVDEDDYSYFGSDMNWFIFNGAEDYLFSYEPGFSEVTATFDSLSPDSPVIQQTGTTPGVGHFEDCRYIKIMMDWIQYGIVSSLDDYEFCCKEWEWAPEENECLPDSLFDTVDPDLYWNVEYDVGEDGDGNQFERAAIFPEEDEPGQFYEEFNFDTQGQ